jgi:hypothetical protein
LINQYYVKHVSDATMHSVFHIDMATTQDQLDPSSKWLNVAGSLGVLLQGVAYLARKEDTIWGALLLLMGGTLLVSVLRRQAVAPWIRAAVLGLMAIAELPRCGFGTGFGDHFS